MIKKFITCGTLGWCLEILFTALVSLPKRNYKLMGRTSLWMFPIYGMAVTLAPLSRLICKRSVLSRGAIYTLCIFITEFVTGRMLKKRDLCPWNYADAKYNVDGVIRLDYAPLWFGTGLLYEYILSDHKTDRHNKTTAP
ncbi:MAG: hypothetical protein J6P60_04240 [Lachnospiraceae bacterium]|nr:hypothetical protein [Lachnospiraceae bacterium]